MAIYSSLTPHLITGPDYMLMMERGSLVLTSTRYLITFEQLPVVWLRAIMIGMGTLICLSEDVYPNNILLHRAALYCKMIRVFFPMLQKKQVLLCKNPA